MKWQEKEKLRKRFQEKAKTLLARRGKSLKQVAERTGLSYDWLRKIISEGSDGKGDYSARQKLTQLALFCGLRSLADWWSEEMPERNEAAIRSILKKNKAKRWPAII